MKAFIEDEEFGKVYVELRRGMTSVRFTYRPDGSLLMRAPLGISIDELKRLIDIHREKLRNSPRPVVPEMHIGQVIEGFRCRIIIETISAQPGFVQTRWEKGSLRVQVYEGADLDDISTKKFVSDMMSQAMEIVALMMLLPFAREVADELGVKPAGFEIGRGMRKLGHCTGKKVIQLSRNIMFLPEDLVRFVICHELAHLTHMNHSPQFHALCDQYTGGKEKELEQKLRQFRWPIMK